MSAKDANKSESTKSVFFKAGDTLSESDQQSDLSQAHLGKLVFRNGPFRGQTIILNPPQTSDSETVAERRVNIGRNKKNDVVIDAGMIVSSFHATIIHSITENIWWIKDLGSKNGTYLNGERVEKAVLREGDVISFALTGPEAQFTLSEPELPSLFETTRSTFLRTRSVEAAVKELLPSSQSKRDALSMSGVHQALDNHLVRITDRNRWVVFSSAASLLLVFGLVIALFFTGEDSNNANSQTSTSGPLAVEITPELEPIYGSLFLSYRDNPIGKVRLKNTSSEAIEGLEVRFQFSSVSENQAPLLVEPYIHALPQMEPNQELTVELFPKLSNEVLSSVTREVTGKVSLYKSGKELTAQEKAIFIHDRNVFNWREPKQIAAFVDSQDLALKEFVSSVWRHCSDVKGAGFPPESFKRAVCLVTSLSDLNLSYLPDAQSPISRKVDEGAIDRVSFPWETLVSRTGDCDDLTVLVASTLERVGIETLIAVTPQHVFLLFDSGLESSQSLKDTPFDLETVVPWNDRIWIPLEATQLGQKGANFQSVWAKGWARKDEILSEVAQLISVRDAWKSFSPMNPRPDERTLRKLDSEKWVLEGLKQRIKKELDELNSLFETNLQKKIKEIVEAEPEGRPRLSALAYLHASSGLFTSAQRYYLQALFGKVLPPDERSSQKIRAKGKTLNPSDPNLIDLFLNSGICFTVGAKHDSDLDSAAGCYLAAIDRLPEEDLSGERAEAHLRLALIYRLQGHLEEEKRWMDLAVSSNSQLKETYKSIILGDGARAGENEQLLKYMIQGLKN